MRMRPIIALGLVAVLAGCGRGKKQAQVASPESNTDTLMTAIAPELEEWVAMWAAARPGFTVDSLSGRHLERWGTDVRRLAGGFAHRYDENDLTFQILGVPSPDGRKILDIDSYQVIESAQGNVNFGGEPDSRAVLLDRDAGTEIVLTQCGTSCGSHWGRWLSSSRFALGGWTETDTSSEWKQGTLSVYDLGDSTVVSYVTHVVSSTDYQRYIEAWKAWLLKRYRETRPRT